MKSCSLHKRANARLAPGMETRPLAPLTFGTSPCLLDGLGDATLERASFVERNSERLEDLDVSARVRRNAPRVARIECASDSAFVGKKIFRLNRDPNDTIELHAPASGAMGLACVVRKRALFEIGGLPDVDNFIAEHQQVDADEPRGLRRRVFGEGGKRGHSALAFGVP